MVYEPATQETLVLAKVGLVPTAVPSMPNAPKPGGGGCGGGSGSNAVAFSFCGWSASLAAVLPIAVVVCAEE
jgi:hypothetical protein